MIRGIKIQIDIYCGKWAKKKTITFGKNFNPNKYRSYAICENCGHPEYCHRNYSDGKFRACVQGVRFCECKGYKHEGK
jgi:hypothetical protein